MKATTWLCPVLTLLCATQLVYTAQRGVSYGSYPALDGLDTNALQNDYYLTKRNKPSLSIVNPLDVLRQRLLLEIARRQMKENTRQVELNRAILKNVGKRMLTKYPYPQELPSMPGGSSDLLSMPSTQKQLQQQLARQQADMAVPAFVLDYLQRRQPVQPFKRTSQPWGNYDIDINDELEAEHSIDNGVKGDLDDDAVLMGLGMGWGGGSNEGKLALRPLVGHKAEYDDHHETAEKKPINRSGHENAGATEAKNNKASGTQHQKEFANDFKLNDLTSLDLNEGPAAGFQLKGSNDDSQDLSNGDYPVQRYLYHLHKNHLTRK